MENGAGRADESGREACFMWVLRAVLAYKMLFEQRAEANEGCSQVSFLEKTIPDRGESQSRVSEGRECQVV